MKRIDVITEGWKDYELLDSGNYRKLERFGDVVIDRPDPQALWGKTGSDLWISANAQFAWKKDSDRWSIQKGISESWVVSVNGIKLKLSFGQFKHIGIFPEHKAQWDRIEDLARKNTGLKMLNLFGYTGAASLVAAKAGAKVTHVDASKQTIGTVKENIKLSDLPEDSIRVVVEDALKYTKRLIQRGESFDVILLDPPAFGRGPKGEVWKIEEKLSELMSLLPKLLSPSAKLVILNGYAAGYSARSLGEAMREVFDIGEILYGDVGIKESSTDRILSTGIYSSWQK